MAMEGEKAEQIQSKLNQIQVTDDEAKNSEIFLAENLEKVEEIIGYKFKDRTLLEEALTDSSFSAKCASYERLEYVGDSVLGLVISREQFFKYPELPPGVLTRLRAANVDKEKLARVALNHGLHNYLRHKKPLLEEQIRFFREEILGYPLHSNGLVDAPKVLCDIVESVIGAVFIDCGSSIDNVRKVFMPLLEPIITPQTLQVHPMTRLYELCQKYGWQVICKDRWKESGTYDIYVDGGLVGRGTYQLKKEIALYRAAKNAADNIEKRIAGREGKYGLELSEEAQSRTTELEADVATVCTSVVELPAGPGS
ncbi:Ribonuclease III domain [Dillenia turbinata]|uniref:Ribonuclease III domain n=1 Tax=Dillenia turbinata TaxID=194707 RepID=A0AAN8UXR5_9MAGN